MKWCLLFLGMMVLLPTVVDAHESRPAYLELRQTNAETYDVLWKVPAKGPSLRLALTVRFPAGVQLMTSPKAQFLGGAFIERSIIRRTGGLDGTEIYVEGLSSTMTDVLVRIARHDGSTQMARLTPDRPSFIVQVQPSSMDVAKTYTVLGIQHIWKGIDHLLFVACLLLVAGTGRRMLITITGFTIAHSATLALSALELVNVPVKPVEATIALSIVFLATEIARGTRDTLTYKYPIVVSGSFGLLHGFGFAAVLGEIGLPQTEIPTALLCFNVGVEIGQIAFVAGVLGVIWICSRVLRRGETNPKDLLQRVEKPLAYVVGVVAVYWTIARVITFWY